ncbi:MAG TPA: helix-turn-helix transcriptional regulator [Longimicrobium sp.]
MSEHDVIESSGNVFADLGRPDAEERNAKAAISRLIACEIEARGLTQVQAAELLDTTQPKISSLVRGNLSGFSMDRLFRFLTALGMDVRVEVGRAANPRHGRVLVGHS